MAELPRKDGHRAMMTEALAHAQVEITQRASEDASDAEPRPAARGGEA